MKKHVSIALLLASTTLGGCQTIGRWADNVGSYMPVIGDRCDHWQCLSSEGRAKSDAIQMEKERMENGEDGAPEGKEGEEDETATTVPDEKKELIIPPSTESGVPDVEQRGSRKPFPQPF